MPIYEFKCKDCKHIFDEIRPISEMDSVIACPSCGSSSVERKFPTSSSYLRSKYTNNRARNAKSGILVDNLSIQSSKVGVKVENWPSPIRGRKWKIKDTSVAIDAENADISVEDLEIE